MKPVFDHHCERSVCGARYLYEFQGRAKIPPRFDRWLFFSPKAVRQLQIFANSVDHHIVYFHFSAKIHKAAARLGYRSLFYKLKVFAGCEQRVLIAPSCEMPCSCIYNLLHSRRQKKRIDHPRHLWAACRRSFLVGSLSHTPLRQADNSGLRRFSAQPSAI